MKLFIDIETVPQKVQFVPESFEKKFAKEIADGGTPVEVWKDKAGLLAEFGKIVCVSIGYVSDNVSIKLKSYFGEDEANILIDVSEALTKGTSLVAHNGKGFDYPWLCRRMIINKIKLPSILQIQNLKPWEIKLDDTMEMWRFGQFSHSVSLSVLCDCFGLPSPKVGMDGSQVSDVFYNEKNYQKIASYCEGDVIALINVYRAINYQPPIL